MHSPVESRVSDLTLLAVPTPDGAQDLVLASDLVKSLHLKGYRCHLAAGCSFKVDLSQQNLLQLL